MTRSAYDKEITALLVIDPYNDFISEGGKVWGRIRAVAEANDCVPHDPLRVEPGATSFGSASDLASALRRAEAAHGEHEKRTGQRDENWPDWYAKYLIREQAGEDLPL